MDIFSDPVLLARLQFACTAAYHFIFVPLTIGLGLILAINETRYYRSRDPKDAAATKFWVKIFTATFVAQARVAEVLHGVGLARVVRLGSVGPVDPHRELVDADPGRRGAVRRRLEGRHHRLPDRGDEPVGMAALLAHHRGRAHHGRVRGHGRFRVVPHQEPPQGIRHEDDEAGRRGGHRGQLRHAGHGSFLRRHRRRGAAHEACHDGGHVRLRGASSVRVRVG